MEKTEAIKYSPFSDWLEKLTTYYLKRKEISYSYTQNGLRFDTHKAENEFFTFDTKEGLDNPGVETLTLQHTFVQEILSSVTPVNEDNNIPVIKGHETVGIWSLWELAVENKFEQKRSVVPLFIDENEKIFPAHAQELWRTFSMQPGSYTIDRLLDQKKSSAIFEDLFKTAESHLSVTYRKIEQELLNTTERLKQNKVKAYEFQKKQISRIGIENIRKSREQKLNKEYRQWQQDFEMSSQVIPELTCYATVKLEH